MQVLPAPKVQFAQFVNKKRIEICYDVQQSTVQKNQLEKLNQK